ncbi:hypothetical protein [Catenovulum sediminis]|uniref:Uncharacterized protein n=1 Tax=Catenovulum sediminis TaxID=1740262 RepID=A0ABV1RHW1_9ALTE|nr:hypothetical protein [Catenovulum sediminis]
MNAKKEPPVPLVKTWYQLLMQQDDPELKEHGKNMLISAFGDIQTAAQFIKKHGIDKAR